MIQFSKVVPKELKSSRDYTDEWHTDFDIHFILEKPIKLKFMTRKILVDRVVMRNGFHHEDDIVLEFTGNSGVHIPLNLTEMKLLYRRLLLAEENELKGYIFSDDVLNMIEEQSACA